MQGLHLHLGIPAICGISHVQLSQSVPADSTKWSHVAVAETEEQPDHPGRETIAETDVGTERAGLGALHTAATHEVDLALENRCQQQRQILGVVGVVGVQDHQDVGRRTRKIADAGKTGAAVAGPGLANDLGAVLQRHIASAVRACVVHHDDTWSQITRNLRQNPWQRLSLVMRRHDDRDRGRRARPGGPGGDAHGVSLAAPAW